jgi:hypothetical protein
VGKAAKAAQQAARAQLRERAIKIRITREDHSGKIVGLKSDLVSRWPAAAAALVVVNAHRSTSVVWPGVGGW